jgi:hypothetical protein
MGAVGDVVGTGHISEGGHMGGRYSEYSGKWACRRSEHT